MKKIPRPEHPRPGFKRKEWINLNGEWEFCFDENSIGQESGFENKHFDKKIIVPFCPESKLSGIGNTDFHNTVWYRREIEIPASWYNKRILLHFGAVDYEAIIYVNGKTVFTHKGGYTSFEVDITNYLEKENNSITVCAKDDLRTGGYPAGKQCKKLNSYGCYYTRTTGIWQTVWLEAVPETFVSSIKIFPDIQDGGVLIKAKRNGNNLNTKVKFTASYEGKPMGEATVELSDFEPFCYIKLAEKHLWEVGNGRLYDLKIETILNGEVIDTVSSYFGLRSVNLDKRAFYINNKKVFGRWVLDQGYYKEGIYTAPTDDDLKKDILLSMQLGFNGARLHQKVFEERFLYWADKLGYMVWGEQGNWNYEPVSLEEADKFLPEWIEALERDFNHPAIIGWCPFNETWHIKDGERKGFPHSKKIIELVYRVTKAIDTTRPCIDTSGNYHVVTDIFDVHDYEQDVEKFTEYFAHIDDGIINDHIERHPERRKHQKYNGEPVFMSEYGGIKWSKEKGNAWGYGNAPETEEEFIERYKGLTQSILRNKNFFGFCYTQLYDVEQEQNGLMTYEREFKFNPEIFHDINSEIAEIEKSV